jgi:hypothetical protein
VGVSFVSLDRGNPPRSARPGRQLAIFSLSMVPALAVFYVAAYLIGVALMNALGLAEGDMLPEAGVWGVVAAVCLLAFLAVPQIVGIVLGVKARRLGERRLGTSGVIANAVIAAFFVLTTLVQLVIA